MDVLMICMILMISPLCQGRPTPKKEEAKFKGGDGQSVLNPLAKKSKNTAEEVSDPTYNMEDSADSEHLL